MEILIFTLRVAFLVLIYVFIYIVLLYLIRDLRFATEPVRANRDALRRTGINVVNYEPGRAGAGTLRVEYAPEEYAMENNVYILSGSTRLGRGKENDVVLPDPFASNHHAVIHLRNGQYWLEDLGSRNGTYLNGLLLTRPAVLANGDQIKVGDVIFRFVRWDNEVEQNYRMRPGAAEE